MNILKGWQMVSLISALCLLIVYLALSVDVKHGEAKFYPETTQHYACATAYITVSPNGEDPSCPTGSSSSQNMSHYTSSVTVTISGTGHYKLFWGAAAYWCEKPTPSCHDILSGTTANSMDVDLSTGSKTVTVPVTGASGNGTACGTFQNDFGVYLADEQGHRITSAGCPIAFSGNVSTLWASNNMASWCNSTLTCVSPTPTTAPTSTPVPTTVPTNTPTPTNIPTSTPAPSTAPTNTPAPTTAPTNTPVPTSAPTETPMPTATPTNTPTPTTIISITTPTPGAGNSQSQSQTQTQINTQTVNVSVPESTQQVLSASTAPAQLPSTGVPVQNIAFLISLLPVGLKLRKWS